MLAMFKYTPEEIQTRVNYKEAHKKFINTMSKVTMEYADKSKGVPILLYGSEFKTVGKGIKGVKCSMDSFTVLTTISNVIFESGSELGKHKHTHQTEYIHVLEGDLYVQLYKSEGKEEYYLKTGDVLKIPPGVPHYCKSDNGALLTVTWQPKFDVE